MKSDLLFAVEQDDVIITVSIRLGIRDFLARVREIYEYAVNQLPGGALPTNDQKALPGG